MNNPMDNQSGRASGTPDPVPGTGTSGPAAAALPWWQNRRNQAVAFLLLLLVLLAVVFWLPSAIEPPTLKTDAEAAAPAPIPGKPIESPWSDAQLAKERRAAQDILSNMLKMQEQLEAMSVSQWAAESYQQAIAAATAGDTYYRQRKFEQAKDNYQSSVAQFEQLLQESEQVFSAAVSGGQAAIEQGLAQEAIAHFTRATAIKPNDQDARQGLARAEVLEQLLALLKSARNLTQQQQLEPAREAIEQALALDPASPPALAALKEVGQAIKERDFSQAMSEGYAALYNQRFTQAKQSFRKAQAIKPGATEAGNALTQAQNQHTQTRIQALLGRATDFEQKEQWVAAGENYGKALELDKNIVAARIGQIRSNARAELDKKVETLLADPLRLADATVYRHGTATLDDMRAIAAAGPRLQRQAEQLSIALTQAQEPVTVNLQSDNQTQVTIFKVGNLGSFVNRQLSLKPGRYTVVGIREGYRDVRREFSVVPNAETETIVIQNVEKISQDG